MRGNFAGVHKLLQKPKHTETQTLNQTDAHSDQTSVWLATVPVLASIFADAGETPNTVRMNIFKAGDRKNSRGEKIKGNGLAEHGAIVRRGRKVLIDVHRYGNWLAGRSPVKG